ncbi:MAG: DUF2062 domain-containing protein [Desulfuromonadaceae bacterium]|nr:DUF2062 domain-containing protein [Desulfuromonadaceae bacterium]
MARHWRTRATEFLQQGSSPHQLALCLSLGLLLGIMPLLWGTSLLCFVLAAALRLNHAVIQAINYLLYPLQLALLWPFFCGGGLLFDDRPLSQELFQNLLHSPLSALIDLGQVNLHALALWLLVALVSALPLYGLSRLLVRRVVA